MECPHLELNEINYSPLAKLTSHLVILSHAFSHLVINFVFVCGPPARKHLSKTILSWCKQVSRKNQLNLARVHLSFTQQLKHMCVWGRRNEEKNYLLKGDLNHYTQDSRPKFHFLKRPRICWPHVFHYIYKFILRDKESAFKINKLCICIYKENMLKQHTAKKKCRMTRVTIKSLCMIFCLQFFLISRKKNEILLLHLRCVFIFQHYS